MAATPTNGTNGTNGNGVAALAAVKALTDSVTDLSGDIRDLKDQGRANRKMIWGLAASLVLDITLSVLLGIVAIHARDASHQAKVATSTAAQNSTRLATTCIAGNETRAAQKSLWHTVLTLSANNAMGPPTAAQKKQTDDFIRYIDSVFAPRDCSPSALAPAPAPAPK